jgi:TrmH family RNA methyltransferase
VTLGFDVILTRSEAIRACPKLVEGILRAAIRSLRPHSRYDLHVKPTAPEGRLRLIEGRHNALVKDLRRAFARSEPTSDGCVAIEGVRIIEEAIRSGLRFRAIFFSASAENRAQRLLPQLGSHVETVMLPDKLFASAVSSEGPQGVAALVHLKERKLEDIFNRLESGPVVILAGLQDPGNLGTILRSAEAFGAAGVLLGEGTVSALNSKAMRASAGSGFRLSVLHQNLSSALPALRERGVRVLATSSHKGTPLPEANLAGPLAVLLGNEGAGVPRDLMAQVDETIAIPHSPQVESLNAGIAASIILYEAARQRK